MIPRIVRQCLGVFVLLALVTGVAYPLLVTAIARTAFPAQARGGIVMRGGRPVGSRLIGQPFTDPGYFWSRPSATTPVPFNGAASAGSNLAATNPELARQVDARVEALRKADPDETGPVPVDLVTASASGLDPHITLAAAEYQLARVAHARGWPVAKVRQLVAAHTERRTFGVLGEPRVNVLELNLALDAAR